VPYVEDLPPTRPLVTRYQLQVGRCRGCGRRVQPRPSRPDLRRPGGGRDPGWSPGGGAGLVAQPGAGRAGRQDRPAVRPAGAAHHRRWGRPGGRPHRPGMPADLPGPGPGRAGQPGGRPDETGWRVGGAKAWLWAFVGQGVTVYRVAGGRGDLDAVAVLGADYAGTIERDGWAPYRRLVHATHQTCLAHLLRRCRELVADADRGQAKTPHAVRRILEHALGLRDAYHAGTLERPPWPRKLDASRRRSTSSWPAALATRPTVGCWTTWPESVGTCSPSCGPRRTGHQLARRAGHPPRGRHPQSLGRQPYLGRGRHLAGPRECAPHRQPAGPRSRRVARPPAADASANHGRPRHPRALTTVPRPLHRRYLNTPQDSPRDEIGGVAAS
jgi:hypothetical protein